jgi:hypothetical protein
LCGKDLEVSIRAIILFPYLIESDLISERMIYFNPNKISDVMSCQKDQYLAQYKPLNTSRSIARIRFLQKFLTNQERVIDHLISTIDSNPLKARESNQTHYKNYPR